VGLSANQIYLIGSRIKMKIIFRTRYRIVLDRYGGYDAQYRLWWWPFWVQCYRVDAQRTLEDAKTLIRFHKKIGNIVYKE